MKSKDCDDTDYEYSADELESICLSAQTQTPEMANKLNATDLPFENKIKLNVASNDVDERFNGSKIIHEDMLKKAVTITDTIEPSKKTDINNNKNNPNSSVRNENLKIESAHLIESVKKSELEIGTIFGQLLSNITSHVSSENEYKLLKIETLEKENRDLKTDLASQKRDLMRVEANLQEYIDQNVNLKRFNAQLKSELEHLGENHKRLNENTHLIIDEFENLKKLHETERSNYQNELKILNESLQSRKNQIAEMNSNLQTCETQFQTVFETCLSAFKNLKDENTNYDSTNSNTNCNRSPSVDSNEPNTSTSKNNTFSNNGRNVFRGRYNSSTFFNGNNFTNRNRSYKNSVKSQRYNRTKTTSNTPPAENYKNSTKNRSRSIDRSRSTRSRSRSRSSNKTNYRSSRQ